MTKNSMCIVEFEGQGDETGHLIRLMDQVHLHLKATTPKGEHESIQQIIST